MKSLERRFNNIQERNPCLSSYMCFAQAMTGQNFTCRSIQFWFAKLVDKNDYSKADKNKLLKQLYKLSQEVDECTN